jgi:phospholipase/carboxylesterase
MNTTLDYIEINSTQKETGSVIWLHGLGADGQDFAPIVQQLHLSSHIRFIFPHAPVRPITINNGYMMRGWFDIFSLSRLEKFDDAGIATSVQQIEHLIEKELQRGIPAEKIILAGFSQGAAIALTTGLQYSKKLGGILALSGYLPNAEKVLSTANPANYTTPIFIAHGTEDTVLPYSLGAEVATLLQKNNYLTAWHSYAMGHSVCPEEIGDIAEWLQKILLDNSAPNSL